MIENQLVTACLLLFGFLYTSNSLCKKRYELNILACWSSSKAFVSRVGEMKFKSRPVKSDTVLPAARHRCNLIFFQRSCVAGCNDAEKAPPTRYMLQRDTVSIMKDLDLI